MNKKLALNYIYSSFYQLILIIVPFITAPYLAKTLQPTATGINSYVSAVVQLFSSIGLLGINNYSIREVAYVRNDKDKLTKVFTELISLRFILFIITSIVYLIYAVLSEYKIYFFIQFVAIFSAFLDISWLYMGLEEFRVTVTRSLIVKIINLASIFLFIKSPSDLGLFMFISTIYTVIGNGILYLGVKKKINKPTLKKIDFKKHIKPMIKLFLPYAASLIYLQMDKIMIKELSSNISNVGFYEQAERLVKVPLALITALSSVMLPRVSNEYKNKNEENVKKYIQSSFVFSMYLSIPLMFGIFSISYTMIPWFFGAEYSGVTPIMMIICPIIIFISLSSVCGNQYLTAINDTKTLTKSYCIGAIFNLIFNLILIPILDSKGAAIGTVIAEATVFLIQFNIVKKITEKKELRKTFFKYLSCGLFMLIICTLIGINLEATVLTTILQIMIGITSYFGILLLIKDKLTYSIIENILKRIKLLLEERVQKNEKNKAK